MSHEPDAVQAANAIVTAQHEKFRAELPTLLAGEHAGRWVVYLDGVRSAHDDEREAFRWGCEHMGNFSGFCTARVEPERVIYLHDALRFFAPPDGSSAPRCPSTPDGHSMPRMIPAIHRCNGCGEDCVDDATTAHNTGLSRDLRSSFVFRATGGYSDLFPDDMIEWSWRLCEFCLADAVSGLAIAPNVIDHVAGETLCVEDTSCALATRDPEVLRAALTRRPLSEWDQARLVAFADYRARRARRKLPDAERLAQIVASAPVTTLPLLNTAQREAVRRVACSLGMSAIHAPRYTLHDAEPESGVCDFAVDGVPFGAATLLETPGATARYEILRRLLADNDALRALLAAVLAHVPEDARREARTRLADEDTPA